VWVGVGVEDAVRVAEGKMGVAVVRGLRVGLRMADADPKESAADGGGRFPAVQEASAERQRKAAGTSGLFIGA
jgi:hypothetical protein